MSKLPSPVACEDFQLPAEVHRSPSVVVGWVRSVVGEDVERAGLVEPDAELLIEGVNEREVSLALPPDHLGGSGLLKLQGLLEDLDGARGDLPSAALGYLARHRCRPNQPKPWVGLTDRLGRLIHDALSGHVVVKPPSATLIRIRFFSLFDRLDSI